MLNTRLRLLQNSGDKSAEAPGRASCAGRLMEGREYFELRAHSLAEVTLSIDFSFLRKGSSARKIAV